MSEAATVVSIAPGGKDDNATEYLDVLLVGAGLSGIDAAYRVQTDCPALSYALFEARDRIGGTWDLFRYPGVRSDSDMVTLGFPFRPWREERSLADGPAIRKYVEDTAREFGIDRRIRFNHRVLTASWSSADAAWTVEYETDAGRRTLRCGFLYMCAGYYDYENGHAPEWPGAADFTGRLVHPQFWPEDLDVAGKRVVVIGSGATAVTLVPALAKTAAHVTMLQRSPTYIVSQPGKDVVAARLRRFLPARLADIAIKWKNVGHSAMTYHFSRRWPEKTRTAIQDGIRQFLGADYAIDPHFSPRYKPWDQRLCLVPDGDLFVAIREGRASVVTDQVAAFTPTGLRLQSGEELAADVVVTATGLRLRMIGGVKLTVDGEPVNLGDRLAYRGAMIEGVPNFVIAVGYINASWTLKCDVTARMITRLLRHMAKRGYASVTPTPPSGDMTGAPLLNLQSGYVERGAGLMPRQGDRGPWRAHQNYAVDLISLRTSRIDDGLVFTPRQATRKAA